MPGEPPTLSNVRVTAAVPTFPFSSPTRSPLLALYLAFLSSFFLTSTASHIEPLPPYTETTQGLVSRFPQCHPPILSSQPIRLCALASQETPHLPSSGFLCGKTRARHSYANIRDPGTGSRRAGTRDPSGPRTCLGTKSSCPGVSMRCASGLRPLLWIRPCY